MAEPELKAGATVQIHGLAGRKDLNGATGRVCSFSESKQRYKIEFVTADTAEVVLVKLANLRLLQATDAADNKLFRAIFSGGPASAVKKLLKSGVSVNGSPALVRQLSAACVSGQTQVACTLLEAGANPALADNTGHTSLMALCNFLCGPSRMDPALRLPVNVSPSMQHVTLMQRLLKARADPSTELTNEGINSLHMACGIPAPLGPRVIETMLQAAPALINVPKQNKKGSTPLIIAIELEPANASALLALGADPNKCNLEPRTPLNICMSIEKLQLARELIAANADLDARSGGSTTLYVAATRGKLDFVDLLCNAGANVNLGCAPGNGNTLDCAPLHAACEKGHLSVVQRLIDAGASINRTMNDGYTPLRLAVDYGRSDVCQLLQEHGATCSDLKIKLGCSCCGATPDEGVLLQACAKCVELKVATPARYCSKECQTKDWPKHLCFHRKQKATQAQCSTFSMRPVGLGPDESLLEGRYGKLIDEGLAHADNQDYRKAAKAYRKAILLDPEIPAAYYNFASALHRSNDKVESAEMFLAAAGRWQPQMRQSETAKKWWLRCVSSTFELRMGDPEVARKVHQPEWWNDADLLRYSEQAVALLGDEYGEGAAWNFRGMVLMLPVAASPGDREFLWPVEEPRTAGHLHEAARCFRRNAVANPFNAPICAHNESNAIKLAQMLVLLERPMCAEAKAELLAKMRQGLHRSTEDALMQGANGEAERRGA